MASIFRLCPDCVASDIIREAIFGFRFVPEIRFTGEKLLSSDSEVQKMFRK